MALLGDRESRLLIDGKLVAGGGGTFPTRQPRHRGGARRRGRRDGRGHGRGDRGRAPRVRRHRTGRPNIELRVRCIRQLQQAMRDHVEELAGADHRRGRRAADADVGSAARGSGRGPELLRRHRGVLSSGPPISASRRRWASRPTARSRREAVGVVGAITPWNFPHQINLAKIGPALAAGNTLGAQARPRYPVGRSGTRRADRRAHRLPARRGQHRHAPATTGGCAAVEGPARRHGVVHRVDQHRPGGDGRRRGDAEEGVPRTRRQVGVPGARRRRSGGRVLDVGVHRVDARRTGLRDHHATGGAARPLRRGRRGGGRRPWPG